jgi:hypothetical protein
MGLLADLFAWGKNASVLSDARSQQGVNAGEMFCVAFDKTV